MINHFLLKLHMILSTSTGWISLLGAVIVNYFSGHGCSVGLVVLLSFLDLVWGITSSLKRGTFALSELGRESVSKLSVYGCVMILFVGLDKLCGCELTTIVVCSLISLVEGWSMAGHMLIVFPNMPFLRLLRPVLLGEIANKLGVSIDEAKKYLNDEDK